MGLNYRKLITSIVEQKIEEDDMPNFRWKAICNIISSSKYLNNHGTEGLKKGCFSKFDQLEPFANSLTEAIYKIGQDKHIGVTQTLENERYYYSKEKSKN